MTQPAVTTSPEFWDVDGTPLHTLGWSVETIGDRWGVPPLVGADREYPGVSGEDFRPKTPGPRVLSLRMAILGRGPGGQHTADQVRAFNDNLWRLRELLWTPGRQVALTRRLRLTGADGQPYLHVSTGRAQLASELPLSMQARTIGRVTVELRMADPFFYGPVESVELAAGPPGVDPTVVVNRGHEVAAARHLYVDLVGPLDPGARLFFWGEDNRECSVQFRAGVPAGVTVTLDVGAFEAESSGLINGTHNQIRDIAHFGAPQWMRLTRGENRLMFVAGGTGLARVRWQPPYA